MSIIPTGVSSRTALAALEVQRNSPKLLLAGGIAGVVGAVVLASRATLKLNTVLDESYAKLADIKALRADPETTPEQEKDLKRARSLVTLEAAINITKLYGPPAILCAASIAMLIGSHNILNKRNAALTAAYSALDKAYRAYRTRVVEDQGVDKDREYAYAIKTERTSEVNPATGKKTTVEKKSVTDISPYGELFRVDNPNHSSNPDANVTFLRAQQMYANDRLIRKGYVTLNSVLKSLGIPETSAGQVVGWVKDGDGNGYVDFGLFNREDSHKLIDLMLDADNEIWLDFNVDGVIYDKIDDIQKENRV